MKKGTTMRVAIALCLLVASGSANAQALNSGPYYVAVDVLEERLGPSSDATVTNRIYRQQRVDVHEIKNGWARISEYYDGRVEGKSGKVARWVLVKHLSSSRPPDKPQPVFPRDPRIGDGGIP
jgi:hypothetical protein